MYKQENSEIMALYAISPIHAGSGSSTGAVDLPIQRERHTQWPHIQASGVKGAMRHHFEKFKENINGYNDEAEQFENITEKIFGTEEYSEDGETKSLPGAISVSDAKLLAYPVRSNIAPFVWITCPSVLNRLSRDLKIAEKGNLANVNDVNDDKENTAYDLSGFTAENQIILIEDYEVSVAKSEKNITLKNNKLFKKAERLLLVHDNVFKYAVENCTEIQTQIKIDEKTGTADPGGLRYQELLPADTLMYVLLMYGQTWNNKSIKAKTLIEYLKNEVINTHIQVGGDETLGKGLFEIEWIEKGGR